MPTAGSEPRPPAQQAKALPMTKFPPGVLIVILISYRVSLLLFLAGHDSPD